MKQFVVTEAYKDNYHVVAIDDGKIVSEQILAYYELDGALDTLRSLGYEQAYHVPMYKMKYLETKEKMEFAEKAYKRAQEHPVKLNDDQWERFKRII